LIGGAGSEVARVLEDVAGTTRLLRLGIPDRFIEHGDQALLLAEIGLDRDGIVAAVRARQDSGAGAAEEIVAGSI